MKFLSKLNFTSPVMYSDSNGETKLCVTVCQDSIHSLKKFVEYIRVCTQMDHKALTAVINWKKESRSLDQNRLLWVLLGIMADALNSGRTGGVDEWDCYIDMLSKYGAKFEYFECTVEGYPMLKDMFRAVKIMDERIKPNGKKTYMCKAFVGSSQYDTKEMTLLIDGIFDELADIGVSVESSNEILDYYTQWLEEKAK